MSPTETIAEPQVGRAAAPVTDLTTRSHAMSRRTLYVLLFVSAFFLRFGFMLWNKTYILLATAIYEDCSIAYHLAHHQGFSSPFIIDSGPTAWIAPVYPVVLAAIFRLFGDFSSLSNAVMLTLQCLMAAVTAIAIFALGKRTLGERIGLVAAWVWALSPFFYRWPTTWIWDMPASALGLTVALIITHDVAESGRIRLWVQLGVLWGLLALTNPALLSVLPFTLLYGAIVNLRAKRQWIRGFVVAGLIFMGVIAPWLIRNYLVFHQPVFLRSNYWFEFHLGNYHYSNGIGFSGKHPTRNALELSKYERLGELAYIKQAKEDSFRFIEEHPIEFAALTARRVVWFWDGSFLNFYNSKEWWGPGRYAVLSATGLLGLLFALMRRPRGWLLYAGPILLYPIPYYLAWPAARYRHDIEPLLLLLSVYLAFVLWNELRAHRRVRQVA